MRRATPAFRDLGRRLLILESGGGRSAAELAEAAERISQKLCGELAKLIGPEGSQVLLARAVRVTQDDHPALKTVEVSPSPQGRVPGSCLKGLRETMEAQGPASAEDPLATLVGSFVWLLSNFIGSGLTVRQLRALWPTASLGEAGSYSEEATK